MRSGHISLRDIFNINPRSFIKEVRKALRPEKKKKGEKEENGVEDQMGGIE